jgi:glycogen(starch) synthase
LKILISSHAFAPSLGGIETVTGLLAREFVRIGHSVVVTTQTCGGADVTEFGAPIVRGPSSSRLTGLVKWCDVFWQNNLSLRSVWPALFLRKPLVVTHQGSYSRQPAGLDVALRAKHAVANRVCSVAISEFVAGFFRPRPIVIPNPYDADAFQVQVLAAARPQELVFLGRLVSEKGLDILLESLGRLQLRNLRPRLTIIGSGPEQTKMEGLAKSLGLEAQVEFRGAQSGSELVATLNQHQTVVVPSKYDEPFGVVALEGIACGCAVIGSEGGGLPEAIGPCGLTFRNGDISALEIVLHRLLTQPEERQRLVAAGPNHLARFHPRLIAQRYLDLFETLIA